MRRRTSLILSAPITAPMPKAPSICVGLRAAMQQVARHQRHQRRYRAADDAGDHGPGQHEGCLIARRMVMHAHAGYQFAVEVKIARVRCGTMSPASSALGIALMPLVARDFAAWRAQTYGINAGRLGMGAVIGALNISEVRPSHERRSRVRVAARC